MKNIYKMTIAAVLAATMGSALAASVPGISPTDFEFNQIGSNDTPTEGPGFNAILNVNTILDLVGSTGGSAINVDNYWKSFVKDDKEKLFDYAAAKPMIDELIFTVTGEVYGQVANSAEKKWGQATSLNALDDEGNQISITSGYMGAQAYMTGKVSTYLAVYTLAEAEEVAGFAVGSVKTAEVLYTAQDDIDNSTNLEGTVKTAAVAYTQADMDAAITFTVGGTRMVADGKLAASGQAAVDLLGRIGFGGTAGTLGSYTSTDVDPSASTSGDYSQNVVLTFDPSSFTNPANTEAAKLALVATVLAAADGTPDSVEEFTFAADVAAARVDAIAFANANQLIGQIANQLKNSYLLDTAKATLAIESIIDHHNGFLAASIVDQAKSLKSVIKNIALQQAAVGVGKVTGTACSSATTDATCVRVGESYSDIVSKINGLTGVSTADYNDAVDAIEAFAVNLTEFNVSAVTGYVAGNTQSDIDGQFGDIMIIDGSEIDIALDGTDLNGNGDFTDSGDVAPFNPYTGADWTLDGDTDFDILDGFEATIVIEGLTVELH